MAAAATSGAAAPLRQRWADIQDSDEEAAAGTSQPLCAAPLLRVQTYDSYNDTGSQWEQLNHFADAARVSLTEPVKGDGSAPSAAENARGGAGGADALQQHGDFGAPASAWVPGVLMAYPVFAVALGGDPAQMVQNVNPEEFQHLSEWGADGNEGPAAQGFHGQQRLVRKRCVDFERVLGETAETKRPRKAGSKRQALSEEREGGAAPAASEEEWQHRAAKRCAAVSMVKGSEEYQFLEESRRQKPGRLARAAPRTPDPFERMSKRTWEEEVRKWRSSLRQWSSTNNEGLSDS